jgi:hypothetical protein
MRPTRLEVFDFDNTLFRSPEKPAGWPEGKGWWGRPESLQEPCVPARPGEDWWIEETVTEARRAIDDPDTLAVLMTGRLVKRFTERVRDLLGQMSLEFDEVHLTPGGGTLPFKLDMILRILEQRPEIEYVRIWDDREEHMPEFARVLDETGVPYELRLVDAGMSEALRPNGYSYMGDEVIWHLGETQSEIQREIDEFYHATTENEMVNARDWISWQAVGGPLQWVRRDRLQQMPARWIQWGLDRLQEFTRPTSRPPLIERDGPMGREILALRAMNDCTVLDVQMVRKEEDNYWMACPPPGATVRFNKRLGWSARPNTSTARFMAASDTACEHVNLTTGERDPEATHCPQCAATWAAWIPKSAIVGIPSVVSGMRWGEAEIIVSPGVVTVEACQLYGYPRALHKYGNGW